MLVVCSLEVPSATVCAHLRVQGQHNAHQSQHLVILLQYLRVWCTMV